MSTNTYFIGEAITLDGVSISDEGDRFVCTCEEQTDGKIDATPVMDVAYEQGLDVISTVADFDAGHVRVSVVKEREE